MEHIRRASPKDYNGIIRCDPLAMTDLARAMVIQEALRASTCYISSQGDQIVAYAILDYSFFCSGYLASLVVHSSFRRQGIGSQLLHHVVHRCTSTRLFAVVEESAKALQSFLTSQHFAVSGIIYNVDDFGPRRVYMRECSELERLERVTTSSLHYLPTINE
jgi:ribosomal protein S18 acetylase RimI-like enzyme